MTIVNARPNRLAVDALRIAPRDVVLELGFGPGRALKALASRAHAGLVFGVDRSEVMLRQAAEANRAAIERGRMRLVLGPFSPLPWPEARFDKVLLANVLYFFDTAGRDMSEVHRVLRPGGRVVAFTAARRSMESWPFVTPETHRVFEADELRALFREGGFASSDVETTAVSLPFGIEGVLTAATRR
jgi:ubiquinone/menaquinone biosynthesis C-methylase UbiE